MITKKTIRKSKSTIGLQMELIKTGQLTENCAIFNIQGSELRLSLIFDKKINKDFDVESWYNNQPITQKEKLSQMFYNILDKNVKSYAERTTRFLTSDTVGGESSKILSYFITVSIY